MAKTKRLRGIEVDPHFVANLKKDLEAMQKLQKRWEDLRSADTPYVPNIKTPEDDSSYVVATSKPKVAKQMLKIAIDDNESDINSLAKKIFKDYGTDITKNDELEYDDK